MFRNPRRHSNSYQIDMNSINCTLLCCSNAEHLSQLYTGFGILEKRGLIKANFLKSEKYKSNGRQLLAVLVNDSYRVAYDTADHDRIYEDELAECDLYFKRSYHKDTHEKLSSKILPLGFNYMVCGANDRSLARALWAFRQSGSSSTYENLTNLIHSSSLLSHLVGARNSGRHILNVKMFEGLPIYDRSPTVLFLARTWDPEMSGIRSREQAEERANINSMRADCIRKLRKEFGPHFVGGFAPDDFTLKNFRDCVVDMRLTEKRFYLQTVKNSGICISTMGLDRSNGWKLAEYIANAKAIVTETLHYDVPGDFAAGKNYLSFETADQCVQSAVRLYENPDECYQMMGENYAYYHCYVRPDILVWNTLQKLISTIGQ